MTTEYGNSDFRTHEILIIRTYPLCCVESKQNKMIFIYVITYVTNFKK